MVKINNLEEKDVCYPVNAISCIPKNAIEARLNQESNLWEYKTANSNDFQTMQIFAAREKGFFVPEITSISYSNKDFFYFIFGFLFFIIGIIIVLFYTTEIWHTLYLFYTSAELSDYILLYLVVFVCASSLLFVSNVVTNRKYTKFQ